MASRAVEWWRLNVLAYYYGVILAWRSALGRYFVFRDMPQWFVEIMAADYCSDGELPRRPGKNCASALSKKPGRI